MGVGIGQGWGHLSIVATAGFFLIFNTFVSARISWAAVFSNTEGIHVANIFSNVDLRWDEVDRLDLGRSGIFPAVCLIHKKDGTILRAFGIQESNYSAMRKLSVAKQMVEDLNRELADHKP
jgi:hypothetical protein